MDLITESTTLMPGNCLERLRDVPDGSVDMILCDPPYGTTACKWDSVIDFRTLWIEFKRVLKTRGTVVMTAAQPFTTTMIASNLDWFKYCWVWKKPQGVDPFMAKKRPLNNIEDVVVFYNKQPVYNPQKTPGKPYHVRRDAKPRVMEVTGQTMHPSETINDGDRLPTRVLEFNQERGFHPTQKPVPLFEYLIKTYTNPADTVLDFTMGSGTTGVAAVNTGRKFTGIELDPTYYGVACGRIMEALANANP